MPAVLPNCANGIPGLALLSIRLTRIRKDRMKTSLRISLLLLLVINFPGIARADEVTEWNKIMLETLRLGGSTGVVGTRTAAIVQSAVYDAVNGIERRYTPIHVEPDAASGASVRAAAVQASYAALVQLFPVQKPALDGRRETSLAAIASQEAFEHSQSIARGIEWGQTVADAIVAWRNTDGFSPAPPAYNGKTEVGQWRSTLPMFAPFAAVQLGTTTPWVITSPLQFPIPGPPALNSPQYTQDFNEVKLMGSAGSAARSADQSMAARFWASGSSPSYYWDTVAVALGEERHTTLSENSRLLAMINVAIADAGITVWKWKRDYLFWRPITAIQLADTDGNPFTEKDQNWLPLIPTPPYPDYPSGLIGTSSAGLTILSNFFGANTSFVVNSDNPAMAGVIRIFPDFMAAGNELVDTRVFSGIHFRTADADALQLGSRVANYVIANAFQPINGKKKGQLR